MEDFIGCNLAQNIKDRYTAEDFLEKVEKLRRVCPHISITSDIIVGFPGETQDDYQATIELMGKIRGSKIYRPCKTFIRRKNIRHWKEVFRRCLLKVSAKTPDRT